MKYNSISSRLAAFLLCFALLFAPSMLPQALAVPEDEASPASGAADAEADGDADESSSTEEDSANVIAAADDAPETNAEAALLISPDSGLVLYEKNADERRYPASTTKILTALLVLEQVTDLSETVTAQASDFAMMDEDSSNAGIVVGETVTIEDLLYGLMLPSGNECAYMLARHVGGTYDAFVDMMNRRAEELGCTGTHFSNPCGLHEDTHYTTARDLYRIAYVAMQDDTFVDIVTTTHHRMSPTNMHPEEDRIIYTTNQLIRSSYQPWAYAYCKGLKTGNTSQAGNCFVGYAENGNAKLYSVVMGCDDHSAEYYDIPASFTDTKALFQWGFEAFSARTLATQGEAVGSVRVNLSTDTDQLVLTVKNDVTALLPRDLEIEQMQTTSTTPEEVDAPIHAGDIIGSITYSYRGVDYGTVELVALTDVELSRVLFISDRLSNFFQSTVFRVILVILAVFIVLYILFILFFGGMRRRSQRQNIRKRFRNTNYQRRRRK